MKPKVSEWEIMVEKLANIEHQRWSEWQKYMHSLCFLNLDGSLIIPKDLVERWERQINTPYLELSEAEKESDREQARRYYPYVQSLLDQQKAEIVEMVGGVKSDEPSDNGLMYPVEALHKSYNQALDDIIKRLGER